MDLRRFIQENLEVTEVRPSLRLYQAHARSGLGRLAAEDAPYWAYTWAGGMVFAEAIARQPSLVSGRDVVDFGCGSGLAGIAAAQAGAAQVWLCDVDPHARVAAEMNAALNGVAVEICETLPTNVDLILAGDVFYDEAIADVTLPLLQAAARAGSEVLIGDPGRRPLPVPLLTELARFEVRDFGAKEPVAGKLYRLQTGS